MNNFLIYIYNNFLNQYHFSFPHLLKYVSKHYIQKRNSEIPILKMFTYTHNVKIFFWYDFQ